VSALSLHCIVGFNTLFSNEHICLVVGYIVDLTLILCGVFVSPGNVSHSQVQSVMKNFAGSLKASIHDEIGFFIRAVPGFGYRNNDVVMEKIIDLIKQHCDLPSGNAHTHLGASE
jgi:hypothetical protein